MNSVVKRKLICFYILLGLLSYEKSYSQSSNQGLVLGRLSILSDSGNHMLPLSSATISSLRPKDSLLELSALSDAKGGFYLKDLASGEHIIRITYMGYGVQYRNIHLTSAKTSIDMGNLMLERSTTMLDNIIIRSSMMLINGDTTEFNASHFKTLPNASTEDLLKKMPGIEVDRDGTIRNQGEQIAKVLVDGKPFFGNDPKMATRNLPAEIIEKVQVIDALSEQSQFSGFDDGNRIRTINIITKKDRKRGFFGKSSFSEGDQQRAAHAVSITRLNNDRKISLITQYNNINNQNFSAMDFLGSLNPNDKVSASSGANIFSGNSNGISTTFSAGLNYNDQVSKKTRVAASAMYSKIDMLNNRNRFRETFVAHDSSFFNQANILASNTNKNSRGNVELEHMFDSANTILFRAELNDQHSYYISDNTSHTTKGLTKAFNQIHAISFSGNTGYNFSGMLLYRHRFHKKGRSFSLTLTNGGNESHRNGDSYTYNDRYALGKDTVMQHSTTYVNGNRIGVNLSFTEPVSLKTQLEFNYAKNQSGSGSDQLTNKYNKLTGLYDLVVNSLTNEFGNENSTDRLGINMQKQVNRFLSYGGGLAVQRVGMLSENMTLHSNVNKDFINVLPNLNVQYRKGRSRNLRLNLRSYTQTPNITQLQDVVNNSNVMYVRAGNPDLKQERINSLSFTFNKVNVVRGNNLAMVLNASETMNRIANAVVLNSGISSVIVDGYSLLPGAQYIKPENMNGAYDIALYTTFTKSLKKRHINLTFSGNIRDLKDVNLFNNLKGTMRKQSIGGVAKVSMNLAERFDMVFSSNSNYSITNYTASSLKNVKYFTERLSVEPILTNNKGWMLTNDFDYVFNRGNSAAYNQSIPLWNAGVAKMFSKTRAYELRLTVFDLLKANKSITRNTELNYVEDIRSNVLTRYFLLSFTYQLRKFGR